MMTLAKIYDISEACERSLVKQTLQVSREDLKKIPKDSSREHYYLILLNPDSTELVYEAQPDNFWNAVKHCQFRIKKILYVAQVCMGTEKFIIVTTLDPTNFTIHMEGRSKEKGRYKKRLNTEERHDLLKDLKDSGFSPLHYQIRTLRYYLYSSERN